MPYRLVLVPLLLVLGACPESSSMPYQPDAAGEPPDAAPALADAVPAPADAAPGSPDASADAAPDPGDGTPERRPCTNSFGQALSTTHGRLDGRLVSIVAPGAHGCNGDSGHVHLQVEMNGATYDVAINVDDSSSGTPVEYLARDLPLPDGAWSEGWHTGAGGKLDYTGLGVHAGDFAPLSGSQLTAAIDAELAQANHVSVFMTGYGPDGGHDVHRVGSLVDGAVVVRPLSASPRLLMFHFSTQSF